MSVTHSAAATSARFNANGLLSAACLVLAVALPALVACYLVMAPAHILAANVGLPVSSPLNSAGFQLPVLQRSLVIGAGLVPVGFMAAALMYARRCFLSFSRREYFTRDVVHGLRRFAGGMFLSGASGLIVAPLASLLLSAAAGGRISLTFSVGSSQALLLLFAGVVWQIATVMSKAAALAEENSQFV